MIYFLICVPSVDRGSIPLNRVSNVVSKHGLIAFPAALVALDDISGSVNIASIETSNDVVQDFDIAAREALQAALADSLNC